MSAEILNDSNLLTHKLSIAFPTRVTLVGVATCGFTKYAQALLLRAVQLNPTGTLSHAGIKFDEYQRLTKSRYGAAMDLPILAIYTQTGVRYISDLRAIARFIEEYFADGRLLPGNAIEKIAIWNEFEFVFQEVLPRWNSNDQTKMITALTQRTSEPKTAPCYQCELLKVLNELIINTGTTRLSNNPSWYTRNHSASGDIVSN